MANLLSRISLADTAVFTVANSAKIAHMVDLTDKYEHYRRRFREAMEARRLTNEEVATRMDAHAVTVSKLRGGKISLDDEWRARIAAALFMDEKTLFGDDPLPAPTSADIFKPAKKRGRKPANDNSMLTVYGYAAGSSFGHHNSAFQEFEQVPRPPGLMGVESAYALRTRNESMSPRYLPNEILYVNPEQKAKPGDHVIIHVRLHEGHDAETWVKRFDAMTDEDLLVYQYNPAAQMTFKRQYIEYVHRVLPTNELYPA